MGLKDKTFGIWKRISNLDDDSEKADNQSQEKERIPYRDISKKLKDAMKQNVDVVGRKIIIPSYYVIYFNAADRKIRIEVEEVLCEELKEELYHEIRKINPEFNKRELIVKVKTDAALEDGQFRIDHHIKKPDASEKIEKVNSPVQSPAPVDNDMDYQQTVVEQSLPKISDDAQTVVVQKPQAKALYTLLVDTGEEKKEIDISKNSITIGRSSKDDVTLQNPDFSISRSHVILDFRDGNYYLMPAGINGTFFNGMELELNKEIKIAAGDEIKIMNYCLKIL